MNYDLAIQEFQALIDEIDTAKRQAILDIVGTPEEYIHKCEILVNNFYSIDDYGSTPFSVQIKVLYNSHVGFQPRLNRLQSLVENILKDVKLKQSIANEKGRDKTKDIEIISLKRELQTVGRQINEYKAVLADRVAEVEEIRNKKQYEIDRTRNDYQNQIDKIKHTYQTEIDKLKNAPTGFNYKIWFYIVLFLLLSVLTFGVPYMLKSMNWKYIIGIELAIIFSVLVFYFRNVPGWLQFLIATILALAAIFFT